MTLPPLTPASETVDYDPFEANEIQRVVPTTEAQREIWLADRISPDASLAYNESVSLKLDGALNVPALARALQAVTDRHEALRCNISSDGTELFVTASIDLPLQQIDLSTMDEAKREARLLQQRALAVQQHFELGTDQLIRASLIKLAPERHELILAAHHIVCDGWSFGVIAHELMHLYRAALAGKAELSEGLEPTVGFSDYALELTQPEALRDQADDLQYWVAKYDRSVPTIDLPTDRVRAPLRTFASQREDVVFDAARLERVRKFGAANGATLFATLLGVFAGLVGRLGGHSDVVVGIPVAGQLTAGHPALVGHCVNLLPMRIGVDMNEGVSVLVRNASTALLDGFDHSRMTFGSLLRRLQVARDPSRVPLVPVMFNVDAAIASADLSDPQLRAQLHSNPRLFENAEIFLNISQVEGTLVLECQYNTDLFDQQTMQRWLKLYCTALDRCAAQPESIAADAFAPTADEEAMLAAFNGATVDYDRRARIESLFDAQAAATPDAIAITCHGRQLSYRALQQRATAVAVALREMGAGAGDLVGLCCDRSEHMIVALYGILKSGAGFVPLDPTFPQERLNFMADDAGMRHIVGDDATLERWQGSGRGLVNAARIEPTDAPLALTGHSANIAYVIYTSGSTGRPKGVTVPHHTVLSLLAGLQQMPGVKQHHVMLAVTTLAFDLSVFEDILPLTLGARIVVADKLTRANGDGLRELIESENVTCIGATPSTWRLLLATGWKGRSDMLAVCCGEPLPPELGRELLPCVGELWNGYGPTETTVFSNFYRLENPIPALVPIGKPVANAQIHILDAHQRPVPVGVMGEIYISGDGVTPGYLNRAELTADRFLLAPTATNPERRWYRSGDLGRWRANGLVECQGRTDQQVKIRGYRIELGEIEANLASHPALERAVVITREDRPGDVRIVAYVVPRGGMPDVADLRAHLAVHLPAYMIPQHFVPLQALPLFASGKIDRMALPVPDGGQATKAGTRIAPRNDDERLALQAMEDVLNLPGLSIDDDFFAVGGHSLLAARLTARLNRELHIQLPFRTLFESPTAEKLAVVLAAARASDGPRRERIVLQPGRRTAPLTPMQERIRFMEQLHPGRAVYNAPSGHRLKGPLDVEKFREAFRQVVRRQPTLRTYMDTDAEGVGIQAIADAVDIDMPLHDLSHLPAEEREAQLLQAMQQVADSPMDIFQAPLFRTALFKIGAEEHAFAFVPHHLIWDGWSFDLLQMELAEIYSALMRGEASALPALPVTYGDYAEWYGRWLEQEECAGQLRFWKDRFGKAPMPVPAQTDMPRRVGMSGDGRPQWVKIDQPTAERLRALARSSDATLNMLMMSLYSLMMGKSIHTDSIVIAVPVRGREAPELEHVMGFFTNLLLVQLQIDYSLPFVDYVRYVKQELLAVTSHQQIPFERVAAEPEASARAAQGAGAYHALFSFQDARERPSDFGAGVRHQQIHLRQRGATDDLGLWLMDKPHGLEGAIIYNADIYLPETGEAFRDRFLELLQRMTQNPSSTLDDIADPTGSAAAQVLTRLQADAQKPSDAEIRLAAHRPSNQQLLMPEQAQLAQIWAGVLGIDVNDIHSTDNFFDLGGDSLLAMRALQQSEQALGFRVEARRYIFESLAQLSNAAAAKPVGPATAAAPERKGLFGRMMSAVGRK
ncbi:amino acid adenylation domain-containing protein [Variovorax sp. J22R133]|uniref:non-ribosomal peptide synthetase n=1 Tax=Variovorax brevis TaxID=3053503 RepID=UPI0025772DE2|nr:non-ribosomal peptide synthetase [Variovorax sp. J22R133]MDM0115543.1 amino acid adenylation domain-containing protein [Variovorax sp. J22R133]